MCDTFAGSAESCGVTYSLRGKTVKGNKMTIYLYRGKMTPHDLATPQKTLTIAKKDFYGDSCPVVAV